MKLRIELDNQIKENEIIIKCSELSEEITKIQNIIFELISEKKEMIFYKGNTEVYQVKYKLYELEEILPQNFIRISKSTILNINHIYSITRNITSASLV